MRGSVIGQLILKDWRLHRLSIVLTMAGGAIALMVVQKGGEPALLIGSVWFFIALILIGTMLPISAIVNERKKQNLAFLMSLPISSVQYTAAKLLSTVGMFLGPWLALVTAGLLLIETRGIVPRGAIPFALILAMLPFVSFSLITGAALVGESEGWSIAANVVCNSSYWFAYYVLAGIPGLTADLKSPTPVWSPTALSILTAEFGSIALILGVTFFLQSRKRAFV